MSVYPANLNKKYDNPPSGQKKKLNKTSTHDGADAKDFVTKLPMSSTNVPTASEST